jgi:predicted heme/steroid binding protein
MKEYTLEELADYNGKNGKIYIAYQGQVYDVTNSYLWEDGVHQGLHDAGQDLTETMDEAPHGPEVFKDSTVVGTLKK